MPRSKEGTFPCPEGSEWEMPVPGTVASLRSESKSRPRLTILIVVLMIFLAPYPSKGLQVYLVGPGALSAKQDFSVEPMLVEILGPSIPYVCRLESSIVAKPEKYTRR